MGDILSLLNDINNAQPAEAPLSTEEKILGYARSYLAGPTFNFADNLEALVSDPVKNIGAVFGLSEPTTYDQELNQIRSEQNRFKRNTDYLDNLVEIGSGAILNPLGEIGAGLRGARTLGGGIEPLQALGRALSIPSYGARTAARLATSVPAQAALNAIGADNGADPVTAGLIGTGVGVAGSIVANRVGGTLANSAREADRLKLSAYGVTAADLNRELKKLGTAGASRLGAAEEIPLVNTINEAERAGLIHPGNDLLTNASNIHGEQEALSNTLMPLIREADQVSQPVADFSLTHTNRFINALSGTARDKAQAAADEEYRALIQQMGQGTIEDLQNLKVGLNYKFDQNPYKGDIIKSMRSDLRQEIEDRVNNAARQGLIDPINVGRVRGLNQQWGNLADLKDIFIRKGGKDLGGDIFTDAMVAGSTTGAGATGSLNLAGAVTGNPLYLAGSALLQAGKIPVVKSGISDALREADQMRLDALGQGIERFGTGKTFEQGYEAYKGTPKANKVTLLLDEINRASNTPASASKQSSLTSLFSPESADASELMPSDIARKSKSVDPKVEGAIKEDPYTHAVALTESSMNPKAKNPTSSAGGLFGFIDATARSLGLKDKYDPEQSLTAFKKLTDSNAKAINSDDPKLLYAAHYLGAPLVNKVLKGATLSPREAILVREFENRALPNFVKNYEAVSA